MVYTTISQLSALSLTSEIRNFGILSPIYILFTNYRISLINFQWRFVVYCSHASPVCR
jgi:hypothetical protein